MAQLYPPGTELENGSVDFKLQHQVEEYERPVMCSLYAHRTKDRKIICAPPHVRRTGKPVARL
jgi:hypothetical protein